MSADSVGGVARLVDDWPEEAGGLARNDSGDSVRGDDVGPEATSMKKTNSKQTVAAMRKNLVNKTPGAPGGVSDLWQRKYLKCGDFGSVARKSAGAQLAPAPSTYNYEGVCYSRVQKLTLKKACPVLGLFFWQAEPPLILPKLALSTLVSGSQICTRLRILKNSILSSAPTRSLK